MRRDANMSSVDRRDKIIELLLENTKPIKGTVMAERFGVTRQVIVKDIAILRAKGEEIIATPDGYMINRVNGKVKAIIAVSHNEEEMFEEMNIIVKYGGTIEDVIVEHPLYGEIKGMLMIKNMNELEKFMNKYKDHKAKLLSVLTNGVHIHTISAENEEDINLIISELKDKKFIVSD